MADHYLTLRCESCGANLEIYDDAARVACGFCGTAMLVQRRGGTISLSVIEEAIQRVQGGTDRTAAELALIRLNKELEELKKKETAYQFQHSPRMREAEQRAEKQIILRGNLAMGMGIVLGTIWIAVFVTTGWIATFFGFIVFAVGGVGGFLGLAPPVAIAQSIRKERSTPPDAAQLESMRRLREEHESRLERMGQITRLIEQNEGLLR